MLTLEEVQKELDETVTTMQEISDVTGIGYQTVWRIYNRKSVNPDYISVKRLSDYFEVK